MNSNSTAVNIRKKDYFALPDDQRSMTKNGPMVKSRRGEFVPAKIIR